MAVTPTTKPTKPTRPVNRIEIRPQPKQEIALASPADILIFGGGAGGGKTWTLLIEALRNTGNGRFGGVIFRRTSPQITNEGGLWDESLNIYPHFGAKPRTSPNHSWNFPAGSRISFAHLQLEKTVLDWQGSQLAFIGFDELTHFTEYQFFYMLSRARSLSGVRPYIRATCNPDADSWVRRFISWWIDDKTGFPIPDRIGRLRYFVRIGSEIYWSTDRAKLREKWPEVLPKSVTFVPALLSDNPKLLEKDPAYKANLHALPLVERERLLNGNWNIRLEAGKFFNRSWFRIADEIPRPIAGERPVDCRFWDFASTAKKLTGNDPDFTAGVLIRSFPKQKRFCVLSVIAFQGDPAEVEKTFKQTARLDADRAKRDGARLKIRWEIEGGSAGKRESYRLTSDLVGFDAKGIKDNRDKLTRAREFAIQAEAGNIDVLNADWTENFLNHLHAQPDHDHDDQLDGASGAFNSLVRDRSGAFSH